MAEKPTLGVDEQFCSSCGEVIKKAAEICPKCGVRLKNPPTYSRKKPFWTKKKVYWLVGVPLTLVALLVVFSLAEVHDDTCESIIDDVVNISKDDAPWIHRISNVQEWSRTDQKLLCIGVAQMSSGAKFSIQFYSEIGSDGNRWIGYQERSVGVINLIN